MAMTRTGGDGDSLPRLPRVNLTPLVCVGLALLLLLCASLAAFGNRGPNALNNLESISGMWLDTMPNVDKAQAKSVLDLKDAAARLSWMIFGLYQTLAFALALVVFNRTIADTVRCRSRWSFVGLLWALVLAVGASMLVLDARGFALDRLTGSGLAYTGIVARLAQKRFGIPWMKAVIGFENGLAAAVIIFGALAAGALAANPGRNSKLTEIELGERARKLRSLLTMSAVVLMIGVVQLSAQYRWPAAVLREKVTQTDPEPSKGSLPLAEVVSGYASAVTLTAGGSFSLFMVAVFGTSFYLIDQKVRIIALAARPYDPASFVEDWRKRYGFCVGMNMLYEDLGKILGPLLLAVVGSYLKI